LIFNFFGLLPGASGSVTSAAAPNRENEKTAALRREIEKGEVWLR
jgi:hypothetical protein